MRRGKASLQVQYEQPTSAPLTISRGESEIAGACGVRRTFWPPPASLPVSSRENEIAPGLPDWDLLHLAHVEQVSSAGEVWASVLEVLRSQVPRPGCRSRAGWLMSVGGSW